MPEDVQPVAPSATPEPLTPTTALDQAVASGDMAAFREARRARDEHRKVNAPDVDPASTKPVVQAEGTPSPNPPASEPGKPSGHKGNADTRIQELLADRARERERAERLERELADLRKPQATAPKPVSPPAPADDDPEPKPEDFDHEPDPYAAYVRAVSRWDARREFRAQQDAIRQQQQKEQTARAQQEREGKFQKAVKAEIAKDAAWLDGISEDVKSLRGFDAVKGAIEGRERPTRLEVEFGPAANALAEEILESDQCTALMRHFTEQPGELRRLLALPNRFAMTKEMGRIEAALAQPKAPTPKTVSDAPPPPPTVGTRTTEPVNELDAAIHTGDVAAFRAARLRARMAAR